MLAGKHRHVDGESSRVRCQALDGAVDAPVEVKIDRSVHAHIGRKTLFDVLRHCIARLA